MNKASLIITTVLTAVLGMQAVGYALSDTVQVKLRQHTFLIPKHIAMEGVSIMPDWLLDMSGLDDGSHTTLFRFDDQEVKDNVFDYQIASDNQFLDDIEVLMIALTPQEVSNYKNPNTYAQLGDLWRATGSYEKRIVESAETPGWYKVYRAIEYPNSWVLVSRFPDSDLPVPNQTQDFWIAHCLRLGPEGKRGVDCGTYELFDNIVIEFDVSDYNVPLLDELKEFLRIKVQEWKQSE